MGSSVGVQGGRPFGAVVGPAFEGLLAVFADLLGSDPSLDFGVGCLGWEVAGEPFANVGRGLEQVARLLPGGGGVGRGGWSKGDEVVEDLAGQQLHCRQFGGRGALLRGDVESEGVQVKVSLSDLAE